MTMIIIQLWNDSEGFSGKIHVRPKHSLPIAILEITTTWFHHGNPGHPDLGGVHSDSHTSKLVVCQASWSSGWLLVYSIYCWLLSFTINRLTTNHWQPSHPQTNPLPTQSSTKSAGRRSESPQVTWYLLPFTSGSPPAKRKSRSQECPTEQGLIEM